MNEIIISLHIPKTGGFYLGEVFNRLYGDDFVWVKFPPTVSSSTQNAVSIIEKLNLDYDRIKVIHGHFPYGIHSYLPSTSIYKYMTFIRSPYERLLSIWEFYTTYHKELYKTLDFHSFYSWVKHSKEPTVNNNTVRYLCGDKTINNIRNKGIAIDLITLEDYYRAIKNLSTFWSIGLTERYEESLDAIFNFDYKNKIKDIEIAYSFPDRRKFEDLDIGEIEAIVEKNFYDIELYRYVKSGKLGTRRTWIKNGQY